MPNLDQTIHIKQAIPLVHAQELFRIGNFPVSNSTATNILTLLVILLLSTIFIVKNKNNTYVSKYVVVFEIMFELLYDFTNKITTNVNVTKKIIFLVGALFFYLVIANNITSLPPFSFLEYKGTPLFRAQTSDFSTTFGIATCLVLLANYKGLKSYGVIGYINEYIPFYDLIVNIKEAPKKTMGHLFNFMIGLFMGILDLVGEVGKTLSVSLRLFGNMYAGQILMVVALGLFSLVLPAFLILYSVFSGLLQALIFTALISVYFTTHQKS